jgi:hypothetical protein
MSKCVLNEIAGLLKMLQGSYGAEACGVPLAQGEFAMESKQILTASSMRFTQIA